MEIPNGRSTGSNVRGEGQDGVGVNGCSNGSNGIVGSPLQTSSTKSSPEKASDTSTDSYVQVHHEDTIVDCTLPQLMEKMRLVHYNISVDTEELIYAKCKLLFEQDYEIRTVRNEVTENYPKEIIIPVAKKNEINAKNIGLDTMLYSELIKEARVARLRSRVVAPVILFDDKFVCRSGTLTVWLSAIYEAATQPRSSESSGPSSLGIISDASNVLLNLAEIAFKSFSLLLLDPLVMNKLFSTDSKILELLKVEHICDLMVEYNKHFKQQVNVSATEKVHEEFYKDLKMEEMPYPGCEFFTEYSEANRNPDGLMFDWNQSDVTRTLELKEETVLFPAIDTLKFKEWDLVELTANYLKIMLSYLVTSEKGMVVHCISGWDRTPLFVSLIRLSLWADGVVHQNLEYRDIAYLTLAYDWFLFGHNLPDRLSKKEEVMHFCFNFLRYITSDDFSVTKMFTELPEERQMNRKFPEFKPGRRLVLNKVRALVLDAYESVAIRPKVD